MKRSFILITVGILMLAAALALTGFNAASDKKAGEASSIALEVLSSEIEKAKVTSHVNEAEETHSIEETLQDDLFIPDHELNREMDMPEVDVNGSLYIGYLDMPTISLKLPVISSLDSEESLNTAPCRYKGSAYLDNMIIAAHNYRAHFGSISALSIGDRLNFTDMDGNVFTYEVTDFETIKGTMVDMMSEGDWDLTLFTCTLDSGSRITVRCERIK